MLPRTRTTRFPLGASLAAMGALALTACVPPAPEPTPAPSPAPTPTPAPPPPPPPPVATNWMDRPQTPGDWRYVSEAGESLALFGTGPNATVLTLRCNRANRRIGIAQAGALQGQATMTIRTETQDRALTATSVPGIANMAIVELPATDPLLDAMAFSKGRFAVETAGVGSLYVPSYPEVTRVIEDCRS